MTVGLSFASDKCQCSCLCNLLKPIWGTKPVHVMSPWWHGGMGQGDRRAIWVWFSVSWGSCLFLLLFCLNKMRCPRGKSAVRSGPTWVCLGRKPTASYFLKGKKIYIYNNSAEPKISSSSWLLKSQGKLSRTRSVLFFQTSWPPSLHNILFIKAKVALLE